MNKKENEGAFVPEQYEASTKVDDNEENED